jgi:PAS domain S-box-containing protein
LLLVFSFASVASAAEKSVLFIHTDKSNGPGVILYDKAFQAALNADTNEQIVLYNEYTDLWRFGGEDYAKTLVDFYRRKYAGQHFDLIVVEAAPALRFLVAYGEELFPGTPVVFCVIMEGRQIEGLSLKSNFTGVLERTDFGKSLEIALRLQPDTRLVVVVGGTSPADQSYLGKARQEFLRFEGQVDFTYLTDLPLEEIERRVSTLPEHSIVFYVNLFRDSTGRFFTPTETAARIGKAANAPFYSFTELFSSPAGGVGGYLWSAEADAMEAAKTARQIIAGARPQDLPVRVGDTNRYIFDWPQLRRWGISESRLPPGSILRNREPSFWEQYRWRIVAVTLLCMLEALLIVWLLINRHKRLQAEEAKNNLAAIVECSDDAILSETLEGTITSWNAGAEKMYGHSAGEIVGQHVSTLAPPDLKNEVFRILEQVGRGESVYHLETARVTRDGRRIDVSLTISPIRNERRVITGASTIARDITARKRAEVEALQQRAELAHLSRVTMLGELSGSLAHELNQPLTAILSNAQAAKRFLARDDVDLEEVRDILTDIVEQDKRAGEVIHRMRLLLKKGEVQQQPLDVNNAVREVLKLIRSDLVNQGVTTRTTLAPALPTVKGDRVQLQQVLLNLLMNACDGMNGNASADRQIIVRTELSDGEGVRFSVSDRGTGIAPEELEHVFEPFFTTKINGLGLGLSVCRTIITAHGGKLWAANNPERGVTFHFTLPVTTEVNV